MAEAIALSRNQLAALAGAGPGAGDSITRPQLALTTPAAAAHMVRALESAGLATSVVVTTLLVLDALLAALDIPLGLAWSERQVS